MKFETLTEKQKLAVAKIEEGKNVFVTSKAGCGKSYLLQYLRRNSSSNTALCASTGVSAANIGGTTLHSFFMLGEGKFPDERIITEIRKNPLALDSILNLKTLIIDEISMISSFTFELAERICRNVRNSNKIFGGVQIVAIGDFLQLPPIIDRNKFETFCFESSMWKGLKFETVLLSEVKRQKNKYFVSLLDDMRKGKSSYELLEFMASRNIKKFTKDEVMKKHPVFICAHNSTADEGNEEALKELPGKCYIYNAVYEGDLKFIEYYKKSTLIRDTLKLKVGSQVMLIKNLDVKEGLANGSIGEVISFSNGHPVVKFFNGKEKTINPYQFQFEEYSVRENKTTVICSISQLPLMLAHALTIHKVQGVTLEAAILDLSGVFERGHIYTAMSRLKSPDGLFIKSFNPDKLKADPKIIEFYEMLERQEIKNHLNKNNPCSF